MFQPVAQASVITGWQPGPTGWYYWYNEQGDLTWAWTEKDRDNFYPRQGQTWGPAQKRPLVSENKP